MSRHSSSGLKVLFVASECAPLLKTGGLGDVVGSLPPALQELGLQARVVMPFFSQVDARNHVIRSTGLTLTLPCAGRQWALEVYESRLKGCRVYLLKNDALFDRPGIYGDSHSDYGDSPLRFTVFCRGVMELSKSLDYEAQVVHAHDWQTALMPALLQTRAWDPGLLGRAATVLTIHNLSFQGRFDRSTFAVTGLPRWMDSPAGAEFWGSFSLLKAGLLTAGAITAVSPTYAQEILSSPGGEGMEGVLLSRRERLHGILNGVDYDEWSPQSDALLPANYSASDMAGKERCRQALLEAFGLKPADKQTTVLGFVGRLTHQKGVNLLTQVLPQLMKENVRLCLLGTGDPHFERQWEDLALEFPGRLGVKILFQEPLAHLIQAGSDFLVMPSLFEPCGLNQMFALRYGTPPVVRAVGGLKDTVIPFDPSTNQGAGFTFPDFDPAQFLCSLREAMWTKFHPARWRAIRQNAMAQDFSWQKSAQAYLELYQRLIG